MRLPVEEAIPDLLKALSASGAAVLIAPPGSGKTTRVPLALLASPEVKGRVILLQPRRVAARSVATWMASTLNERVGETVGYQVRHERRLGPRTRVEVITEGLLIQRLIQDPELKGIGAVILDEFHERSINLDLSLMMLIEAKVLTRPDLKLIVMSATMKSERLCEVMSAPLVTAEGRSYPVSISYLEQPLRENLADQVARHIIEFWGHERWGHCLVFLPGRKEIEEVAAELKRWDDLKVTPLYGALPLSAQKMALDPSGEPRVILATNLAETSLTIDGVTHVIDSGLSRRAIRDGKTGLTRLRTHPIAQDSADQRAGRAGRTQAGRCLRLWTERENSQRDLTTPAELSRVELSDSLLRIAAWSGDWRSFSWFEEPSPKALLVAEETLKRLGALSETRGGLTPLGEALALLSTTPPLARALLLGRALNCLEEVAFFCALSESQRTLLQMPADHERACDPWLRWEAFIDGRSEQFWPEVNRALWNELQVMTQQFVQQARQNPWRGEEEFSPALQALSVQDRVAWVFARSLPHRIGILRSDSNRSTVGCYRLSGGGEGSCSIGLLGSEIPCCVALSARVDTRGVARLELIFSINPDWISVEEAKELIWSEDHQAIVEIRSKRVGQILLEAHRETAPKSNEKACEMFQEVIRDDPWRYIQLEGEAQRWLQRLAWLKSNHELLHQIIEIEQLPSLPNWDTARGAEHSHINDLLSSILVASTAIKHLRYGEVLPLMKGLTHPRWVQCLDQYIPETFTLPTGKSVLINYAVGDPPMIEAYLQAFFGEKAHPLLGGIEGGSRVQLRLLAPNGRVTQITSDLPSFWERGYADVRRQLRGRYPKHHWPEDPLSMGPQSGAKRKPIK